MNEQLNSLVGKTIKSVQEVGSYTTEELIIELTDGKKFKIKISHNCYDEGDRTECDYFLDFDLL